MKNVIKNTKFLLIATAVIILVIVSTILLTGKTQKSEEIERPLLSKDMIFNLLINQDDLPWDVVLFNSSFKSEFKSYKSLYYNDSSFYQIGWVGKSIDNGGDIMPSPECSINITVAITNSFEEAMDAAYKQAHSYSVPTNDLMNDEQVSAIADCAWGHINYDMIPGKLSSMIYTRNNVVLDIDMSHYRSSDPQLIIDLAALLSRKIDAALTGKPEPIPILPLAADKELNMGVDDYIRMHGFGSRVWGKDSKNIALYDVNGIPRSLPAGQLSNGDYLVPLRHLGAIIGPLTRPTMKYNKHHKVYGFEITLIGKLLEFTNYSKKIKIGDRTIEMDQPIASKGGEIMVPLKFIVQEGLGKKITWSQWGSAMVGKVE